MALYLKPQPNNYISSFKIPVSYLDKSISVVCTYKIDEFSPEYRFANIAIGAIDAYVNDTADMPFINLDNINIFLCDDNLLSFGDNFDPHACTCGNALIAAICNVQRMKSIGFNEAHMVAVLIEEIVHIAYGIFDETAVKHKVISIMNQYYGVLDFKSFYASFPGKPNLI